MASAWITLWTNDRCRWLQKCGDEGRPLEVMFGGVHLSLPSLRKAGVVPGDTLFPIRVYKGDLYVIGSMIAREYIDLRSYAEQRFLMAHHEIATLDDYCLKEKISLEHPNAGQYLPYGCGTETLLGEPGTAIRFDRKVPCDALEALTFCSKRSRMTLKRVRNGKLTSVLSLQGRIRRLCPESATIFEEVVCA